VGILVRGKMKRYKTKTEEQVTIAIDGKVIRGEVEQEHKEWVPKKTVELYEGFTPKVKEHIHKDGSISIELVGSSKFTQLYKESIARIITKSGKIPDMNKPRGYWGFKYFKARAGGGGFDNMLETQPKPEKFKLPKINKGDKVSIRGVDYNITSKSASKVHLKTSSGQRSQLKMKTFNELLRLQKAYVITAVPSREEMEIK